MKKRILSFLLAVCMVLSIAPMPAYAEDVPIYYCGEEHTHTDTCLVDPSDQTVIAPISEEEPQEDTQTCTCETACADGAMNSACAICGTEGAAVENCGKYVAPAVCTCETACTAENMNFECTVCGAEGATVEGCGKYVAPVSYTVTFHVGEHGTAPENQTVTEGSSVTKPADPTAEGYIFDGWYADAAFSIAWNFDSDVITQDTTLYAKWKEDTAAEDTDGDGYVEIDTAGKLWWFTQQVNGGNNSLNAELTANIDLSGTCGEGLGNWTPISHQNGYGGHFNGQGHTVSNLYMTGDEQYVGLFGYVYGATIENVTVTGSVSTTMVYDENYNFAAAGGIVAYLDGGTIRNCHVDMTVSGGNDIGGICGTMYRGLIEDCTVNGYVICNALSDQGSGFCIGGIVGCQYGGTVRGCVNRATASAENSVYFGGIAGLGTGDAIENCLNYGTFNAIYDSTYAGGTVAGGIVGSGMTVIRGCGNLGSINISGSGEWTGGIVGVHQTSSSIVENCYNVGSITSSDGKFGVIVGAVGTDAIVTNNYYLSDTTTEDGGRTTEQFASGQVTYELNGSTTAEDNVWRQTIGTDAYPVLSGKLVYYGETYQCDGTSLGVGYSNTAPGTIPPHTYGDNGLCTVCRHSGTPAELNAEGYYEIDTPAKLWWFSQQVNGGNNSINAVLTADIDLSGTCGEGIGSWEPIGGDKATYQGRFDGQGYTISNLYVNATGIETELYDIAGLFGNVYRGTIENLGVTGQAINGSYTAGIAGRVTQATIRNCWANVFVQAGRYGGGIFGRAQQASQIENCRNLGTITSAEEVTEYSDLYLGGIGGVMADSEGSVRNCANLGNISLQQLYVIPYIGGIVGRTYCTVENCFNIGSFVQTDGFEGPIAGDMMGTATLNNCYYLSDTETEDGGRTAEQFASGQVAYELNGSTTAEENVWRQTIGTDSYPVFSGVLVYCNERHKCDGTVLDAVYSNASETVIVHEDADADGFCDLCGWLIISEKTFPDETFRNIISSAEFDVNQDGLLSPEEIASVTFLQLENTGLTDVTGIHYFTELTDISAYDNDLKTLDLSGLSKLENLYLQDNYNLASLNLEGCSSLRELCLSGCMALASLKMEDCTALDYLDLSYCDKLQDSLDVSHLTELTYLCVDDIGLRELDLSANTKLEELSVRNTGLTWLDLSNTAVYRLEGMAYLPIKHCGVGYVNMKDLVKDTANIVNITGGTLGEDGWLKLDDDADEITYEYVTGAEGCNLSVTIYFNQNYVGKHTYIDQPVCKDEAGHYTRICSTCRTIDETSYEPCVYDNDCDTECNVCGAVREITHTYDSDCDTECNICGEIRTVTHPYVNGFCTACGGYEEPEFLDGVYQIANAGNLFWFAQTVNGGKSTANAALTADIDLENREWSPIDNFSGAFDGGGHSITGLLITAPANRMAFFGRTISPAVIQNFTISGLVKPTTEGDWYLGGVAVDSGDNEVYNGSTISNVICYVDLDASAGKVTRMGGIVTSIYGGNVTGCLYLGTIQGSANDVGGIVGYARQGRIENCGMAGSVSSSSHVGGILGYVNNNATYVKNCYVFGSVQSTNATRVGAIIGRARSNFDITKADNNYYNGALTTGAFGTECEVTFGESAATDKTAEAFRSGEVTWLLNGASSEGVWHQTLDGESLPGFSGGRVYYNTIYRCDGLASYEYSNTQIENPVIPDHQFDSAGLCPVCQTQAEASLTDLNSVTTIYTTLAEALQAVAGMERSFGEVKLLTDVRVSETIKVSGGIIHLYLNGKTLAADNCMPLSFVNCNLVLQYETAGGVIRNQSDYHTIRLDNSEFTMDGGTIEANATAIFANASDVYLYNGVICAGNAVSLDITDGMGSNVLVAQVMMIRYHEACFMVNQNSDNGNTIQINRGTFINENTEGTGYLLYSDYDTQMTISGGTFENGVRVCSDLGSSALADYLAEGYAFYDADGSLVSLAEGQSEISGDGTFTVEITQVQISVDITWGDLSFTYSDGTWNPDTLTYEGRGWTADTEGGNAITVKNSGSEAVTVSVSYIPAEGYTGISGSFTEISAILETEEEKKFWLLLSGKPENEMSGVPLGTVTVTIGGE